MGRDRRLSQPTRASPRRIARLFKSACHAAPLVALRTMPLDCSRGMVFIRPWRLLRYTRATRIASQPVHPHPRPSASDSHLITDCHHSRLTLHHRQHTLDVLLHVLVPLCASLRYPWETC